MLAKGSSLRANQAYHKRLINQTLRVLENTGLPVFHWHEGMQKAQSFGDRLTEAIACLLNQGFEKVLVVGNDSPFLNATRLTHALQLLAKHQSVLGATPAGGAYLIGLSQSSFKPADFSVLPWQTKDLALALREFLALEEAAELEALGDLNSYQGLLELWQCQAGLKVLSFLSAFFQDFTLRAHRTFNVKGCWHINFRILRAPPYLGITQAIS